MFAPVGGQIFEELKQHFIEKMQGCVSMRPIQLVLVLSLEVDRVYDSVCQ